VKKASFTLYILFFLSLSFAAFLMTGCSKNREKPIVTVGEKELYLDDFIYDIYLVEKEGNALDENYWDKYGYGYWDFTYGGSTLREMAKNSIMASVVMHEILSQQAEASGLSLSDQETLNCQRAISTLMEEGGEDALVKAGISPVILKDDYLKMALSDKFSKKLSTTFQIEEEIMKSNISKEEYQEYKTECIYVPINSSENQKKPALSEADKNIAFEKINKVKDMVEAGTEVQTLLDEDDGLKYYSRDFIATDPAYEKSYIEAALPLKNGEVSEIIPTDFGYYIIHMLDNNSLDRYKKAVEEAITAEKNRQFDAEYNRIKEQYDITINFKYWDTLTIGDITVGKND